MLPLALLLALSAPAPASSCPAGSEQDLRGEFERWTAAYEAKDLAGTMAIFAPEVRFQFQGAEDQGWAELEASYRSGFERNGGLRWTPAWDEVLVSGDLAAAFATWTGAIVDANGVRQVRMENRSVDIFRRGPDCRWRIVRSLTYPLRPGG